MFPVFPLQDVGGIRMPTRRSPLQRDDLRIAHAIEDVHGYVVAMAAQQQIHARITDRHAAHVHREQGFGQPRISQARHPLRGIHFEAQAGLQHREGRGGSPCLRRAGDGIENGPLSRRRRIPQKSSGNRRRSMCAAASNKVAVSRAAWSEWP